MQCSPEAIAHVLENFSRVFFFFSVPLYFSCSLDCFIEIILKDREGEILKSKA